MLKGSQAEFSRWVNISPQAVSQFAKAGRIVFESPGIVDFEASKKKIADTSEKPGRTEIHARNRGSEPNISEASDFFQKSKAKKEYYKALQAKADYEQSIGELIPLAEIKELHTACAIILRESFQRMPDFLGEELFAADSAEQIKEILTAHINELLDQAAKNLDKY